MSPLVTLVDVPTNYIGLDTVQEILNGTFKKTCWQHGFMLTTLWQDNPQLAEETRKRAHRKAYRTKLEAKRSALRAKGVLGKGDTR